MIHAALSENTAHSADGIHQADAGAASLQSCEECLGSGGWFRYEPALDPAPGLLYLACVQCRGSGRTALFRG
jgi:hypothetical protein